MVQGRHVPQPWPREEPQPGDPEAGAALSDSCEECPGHRGMETAWRTDAGPVLAVASTLSRSGPEAVPVTFLL